MADQADQQPKRPRGNPRWAPGGPSPNPGGRGAAAGELQRAIRRGVNADELVTIALTLARSGKEGTRIAALQWLAATGYDRPVSTSRLEVGPAPTLPAGWDSLSPAERDAYLDEVEASARPLAGAAVLGLLPDGEDE